MVQPELLITLICENLDSSVPVDKGIPNAMAATFFTLQLMRFEISTKRCKFVSVKCLCHVCGLVFANKLEYEHSLIKGRGHFICPYG